MKDEQLKQETIDMVKLMIQHSDKGPSGFWVEDHEGCGNPAVFPEFAEGLKHGTLINKNHYICPWNTAVLYAEGRGNIRTGCYHSCSICDARCLSPDMLKAVLCRFSKRMQSGQYDDLDHITPLLNENEKNYIQKQKVKSQAEAVRQRREEEKLRKKAAAPLLRKYRNNEDITGVILANYGSSVLAQTYFPGDEIDYIDFSPSGKDSIIGGKEITYNQYIDLQIRSHGKSRRGFSLSYYGGGGYGYFFGEAEKITKDKICFKRIYISGMYPDADCFEAKEDHVWMDLSGFEEYQPGDRLSFYAEVYRYIKRGNGTILDYGLRNPEDIHKIGNYELPGNDKLLKQTISELICDICPMNDYCSGSCLNAAWKKAICQDMYKAANTEKCTDK